MDASALDHHVYEGRGWPRPRREPEPVDDHASMGGRGRRAGDSVEAARAPVVSLVPDADDPGQSADFRVQLVDAMHAAARAQHSRIVTDVEERQAAYVSAVHGRASAEVDAMRASADGVNSDVASWAAVELERIEREREQKLDAARTDFQQRLDSHEALVERQIADARARVAAYRAEIEAFFSQLDAESDPAVIAQLAARVPAPPNLDEVATATSRGPTFEAAIPAPALSTAGGETSAAPTAEETTSFPALATEGAAPAPATAEAMTDAAPAAIDAATTTPATFPAFRTFEPSAHGHDAHAGFEAAEDTRQPAATARDDLGWDSDGVREPEPEAAAIPVAAAGEHIGEGPGAERAMAAEHGDERHDAPFLARPALVEREAEPAAPTGKPKDLIRERLRYIAERRAALTDVGAGAWSTEPAPNSRPV